MAGRVRSTLIFLAKLVQLAFAVDYRSSMLTSRITHYDNPHVQFDVRYFGEEGFPFLTLNESITPYNDFHVILYTKVYDAAPNLIIHTPLSLCQLLHDQKFNVSNAVSQFNLPQMFNLVGKVCPVEQERIRLSPYIFPPKFSLDTNIGCGYQNLEARLLKCSPDPSATAAVTDDSKDDGKDAGVSEIQRCDTLLKTVTLIFLDSSDCIVTESSEGLTDDNGGWIKENVARAVAKYL